LDEIFLKIYRGFKKTIKVVPDENFAALVVKKKILKFFPATPLKIYPPIIY